MTAELFSAIYSEEIYDVNPPVTIVLGHSWQELKPEERQLLSKILLAIGQSIDRVRVVTQAKLDLSKWSARPSQVIAFVPPSKGVNLYEVIRADASSIIFSDPLEFFLTNESAKKTLWAALKAMFPA